MDIVKDSNGNTFTANSVVVIKTLKVKGHPKDIKRGQVVKNIRLTSSSNEIEGKVDGVMLVIKTSLL